MRRKLKEGISAERIIDAFVNGEISAEKMIEQIIENTTIPGIDEKVSDVMDVRYRRNQETGPVDTGNGRYNVRLAFNRVKD